MNLQKANTEKAVEFINLYNGQSIEKLRDIQPKWAYGKNADKLLDYIQAPVNDTYTIFLVDPFILIQNAELNEVNPNILFTGEMVNDYRVARILSRWENGQFVDPPSIGLCSLETNRISFTDGRHRCKTTYLLGHKQLPIAINNFDIEKINKIIPLTHV